MADVKFGRRQLGNPTPQGTSVMMDFYAGLCGIVAAFITTAKFIPHDWSDPISTILTGLCIPVLLYMKRFFGVQIQQTSIDIDKVAEIKQTEVNKPIDKP